MKKESIGFFIASFCLMLLYFFINSYYLEENAKTAKTQNQPEVQSAKNIAQNSSDVPGIVVSPQSNIPSERLPLIVENPEALKVTTTQLSLKFTAMGGCIGENSLNDFQVSHTDKAKVPVIGNYYLCKAYGFKVGDKDLRTEPARIVKSADGSSVQVTQRTEELEIIRTFSFNAVQNYFGSLSVAVLNLSSQNITRSVDMELGATSDDRDTGGILSSTPPLYHGVAVRLPDGTLERENTTFESAPHFKALMNKEHIVPSWIAIDSLYWLHALIPQFKTPLSFTLTLTGYNYQRAQNEPINQTGYEAWVKQSVHLAPQQSVTFDYKFYLGPKEESILEKYDEQDKLTDAIDYGFFKVIARPMYFALNFFNNLVNNWGVAIIILTVLINLLFMPLHIKGYLAAKKMQVIQPQMKQLQEKYKDDKAKLHQEMMSLMSANKVNPLSGCLPLLPQIPVFFGLNACLMHTFGLRQAPFFLWIDDLSAHDPYFVLPIVMAVLMLGYQKMVPLPSMAPTQAKIMKALPILFSIFMIFYPSGLAIYVITNTLLSMIRQAFLMKRYSN
ncbi:MAG: membrane protein insertase YidC [Silvanigrellaceae bacterium]|nr:membrane protein insertase YidC [Silvanigrellaceae bacterium]